MMAAPSTPVQALTRARDADTSSSLRVYVSAAWDSAENVRKAYEALERGGAVLTRRWADPDTHANIHAAASTSDPVANGPQRGKEAEQMLRSVADADVVIVLLDAAAYAYRGTTAELAAALALGKHVVLVHALPPDCYTLENVLFWHPNLVRFENVDQAVAHVLSWTTPRNVGGTDAAHDGTVMERLHAPPRLGRTSGAVWTGHPATATSPPRWTVKEAVRVPQHGAECVPSSEAISQHVGVCRELMGQREAATQTAKDAIEARCELIANFLEELRRPEKRPRPEKRTDEDHNRLSDDESVSSINSEPLARVLHNRIPRVQWLCRVPVAGGRGQFKLVPFSGERTLGEPAAASRRPSLGLDQAAAHDAALAALRELDLAEAASAPSLVCSCSQVPCERDYRADEDNKDNEEAVTSSKDESRDWKPERQKDDVIESSDEVSSEEGPDLDPRFVDMCIHGSSLCDCDKLDTCIHGPSSCDCDKSLGRC